MNKDYKESISHESSHEEFCKKLADDLGVSIPDSAVQKAQRDPRYHYHLLAARDNPLWIKLLFDLAASESSEHSNKEFSDLSLGFKLAKSAILWASIGFKQIDEGEFNKRWQACQSCPHLVPFPERLIYHLGRKILNHNDSDQRICALCGCLAYRKAQISTERCPGQHPFHEGLSRWD
jgi:hypothetical protein